MKDSKRKKDRENETNKVKKEREKDIKIRGNHKIAQERTHARVDSKRKKDREKERNKFKKEKAK